MNESKYRKSADRRKSWGGTLLGVFVGLVLGVVLSFIVVWTMNKTPVPFRNGASPEKAEQNGGTPAALPGKPGDSVGEKSGDKPRFEFYKILPGNQQATPTQEDNAAAKGKAGAADAGWLQAGAFQKAADADNLKAKLALIGIDAGVQEVDIPEKGKMYRVRTGPYSSVDELNRARALLSQNGIKATPVKGK